MFMNVCVSCHFIVKVLLTLPAFRAREKIPMIVNPPHKPGVSEKNFKTVQKGYINSAMAVGRHVKGIISMRPRVNL